MQRHLIWFEQINVLFLNGIQFELRDVGEKMEADFFQCDFNEKMYERVNDTKDAEVTDTGGAIPAFNSVDVYSGYVHGHLVKNLANPIDHVRLTVETCRQ